MRNNPRSSSVVGSVLMPGILVLACASGTALAHNHTEHEQTADAHEAAGETMPSAPDRNAETAPAMDGTPHSNFEEPSEAMPDAAPATEMPAAREDAPDGDAPALDEPPETASPTEEPTEPAQPETADEVPESAPEPGPRGDVSRAQFTSAVEDREPVDALTRVDADMDHVYFFSEIMDHEGGEIIHRWRYRDDQDMGEVRFDVGGPRWRVWSMKTLDPAWTGPWRVEVVTQDGEVLDTYRFELR